jgi:hypothetical protein
MRTKHLPQEASHVLQAIHLLHDVVLALLGPPFRTKLSAPNISPHPNVVPISASVEIQFLSLINFQALVMHT